MQLYIFHTDLNAKLPFRIVDKIRGGDIGPGRGQIAGGGRKSWPHETRLSYIHSAVLLTFSVGCVCVAALLGSY